MTLHTHHSPPSREQVDGFTYERSAIELWLKTNGTSPSTGAELELKILIPCHHLRSLIRDFHEASAGGQEITLRAR